MRADTCSSLIAPPCAFSHPCSLSIDRCDYYPMIMRASDKNGAFWAAWAVMGKAEGEGENWHGHVTAVTVRSRAIARLAIFS